MRHDTRHLRRVALAAALVFTLVNATIQAQDPDGDGIPSASDNCPTMFNPGQGLSVRMSAELVDGGSTSATVCSADSSAAVYFADQEVDEFREMFRVSLDTGEVVNLSAGIPLDSDVTGPIQFSPDNQTVAFFTVNADGNHSIYSVPLIGGTPTKLADGTGHGYPVFWTRTLLFTPDSARLVYDLDAPSNFQLFSVPVAGGTPTPLTVDSGPGTRLALVPLESTFTLTPDGSHVVFLGHPGGGDLELYTVPTEGGTPAQISAGPGIVKDFALSPDGTTVLYHADDSGKGRMYRVPVGGGTQTLLHDLALDVARNSMEITADGSTVVFSAVDQNLVSNIYSVPLDGGQVVQLSGPATPGGHAQTFRISPDGTRVVYSSDQIMDDVKELFSVPTLGGTQVKLNPTLVPGGDIRDGAWEIGSADHVLYVADQETDNVLELFIVPILGGAAIKLNGPGEFVDQYSSNFEMSPDGQTVLYMSRDLQFGATELFAVPVGGGTSIRLSDPPVSGGNVLTPFQITADGSTYVYWADQNTDEQRELFYGRLDSDPDEDGILELCDTCPGLANPDQLDLDADGAGAVCDCDDTNPGASEVAAAEINDGLDNQCPGEVGFGSIDDLSGNAGFQNPLDTDEYSWPEQQGATLYEVARAETPQFGLGCTLVTSTSGTSTVDPTLPPLGQLLFYLVRSAAPNVGSWGQSSGGLERTGPCL